LPFVQLVREDGTMPEEVTDFAGVFCKEADAGITRKLKEEGKLIRKVPYEHSYRFCWRCDTALIYQYDQFAREFVEKQFYCQLDSLNFWLMTFWQLPGQRC
jgi:isoleucyl-tRNA synthetase